LLPANINLSMKHFLLALLILSTTTVAFAAKPNKKNKAADPAARLLKKLDAADLSTESEAKAKKTIEEHSAKLKEAQSKVDAVLTAEQKQAKRQAAKEARQAGKKRKEAQAAIAAALKLTDEQKKKLTAAETELKAEQSSLTKDLKATLPAEDFAKLGLKTKKKA
jgi:hypothetical protein